MKNSKLRRALLLVACAVLLVSISVSATLAYLTSKTEVVTNTFSVGKVEITLDEANVDLYGNVTTGRDNGNEYKLMPGHTYTKDPIVHVQSGSEKCYVFVKIENNISAILQPTNVVELQMVDDLTTTAANDGKWFLLDEANNIYCYKLIVDATDGAVAVPTFTYFTVSGNVKNLPANGVREEGVLYVEDYKTATNPDATIKITAYAVQADGFNTTTHADNAAKYFTEAQAAWNAGFGTN